MNRGTGVALAACILGAFGSAAAGCGSSHSNPSDAQGMTTKDAGAWETFPPACTVTKLDATFDANGAPAPYPLADFGSANPFSWGPWSDGIFSGSAYTYPSGTVLQDGADGTWHVTGMVGDYAGIGMTFNCQIDVSLYTGVSFTIKGNAGSTSQMLLAVGTAPDDVNKSAAAESHGRCLPAASEYDGTCLAPRASVSVSAAAATLKYKWADFKGGKPSDSVDPKAISRLAWSFDWVPGITPYAVDVTIDDIVFTID
ncbi:MAG: hypothetical protein ABUL77_01850 [Bacteroidota bacterium]